MKDVVLKEIRKNEKKGEKLFTKKESKVTIRKNYNPLKVNYKIYKRGSGLYNMKDIILKETIFINEESYQQIKKKMCKKDDYFSEKELEEISVILA